MAEAKVIKVGKIVLLCIMIKEKIGKERLQVKYATWDSITSSIHIIRIQNASEE